MAPTQGGLLRIFLSEADHYRGQPLYQAIVLAARERGLAGATVLRGVLGYGAHSHLHTSKVLALSEDLPLVVEIVDREERLQAFLPWLEAAVGEGLVTLEKVQILCASGLPTA